MTPSHTTLLTTPIILRDWAFSPGPELMDEPTDSQFVDEISQHPAKSIAATLLLIPNMEVVHPAAPSWFEWRAKWSDNDRFICLTMTLFDDLAETWGGSEIEANCLAGDIIGVWSFLLAKHPGVWLHCPDCTMHTPRSFLEDLVSDSKYWGDNVNVPKEKL